MSEPRTKTTYVAIDDSDDFIQCIGISSSFNEAVGAAYAYASSLVNGTDSKKGTIGTLYELEGDTGYGFHVTYGDKPLKANMLILRYEESKPVPDQPDDQTTRKDE